MLFLSKELLTVTEADVSRLVNEGIREGKTLEFKQIAPTDQTEDKKEFLADVCSFANTGGGHIVFGVVEDKGVATKICGVAETDFDALSLKLESSVRNGIEPRIAQVRTHRIKFSTGEIVLILAIGRSWVAPHMVTYKGTSRFFARTTAGKYQLDVQELRSAFTGADGIAQKIKNFRADRIAKILANDTGIALMGRAVTVLHVLPLSSFSDAEIGLDLIRSNRGTCAFHPIRMAAGYTPRMTFDGLLHSASGGQSGKFMGYAQIFRDGRIEAADGAMLEQGSIPSDGYEAQIAAALAGYLGYMKSLNLEGPFVVALSMLKVKGFEMAMGRGFIGTQYPIDRDHLMFPGLLVENAMEPPGKILKTAFDSLWNACGFPSSPNYTADGQRNVRG